MYGGNMRGYDSSILTLLAHIVYAGRISGETLLTCKEHIA